MEKTYFTINYYGVEIEVYAIPFYPLGSKESPFQKMEVRYVKDDRVMGYIWIGSGRNLFEYAEGNDPLGGMWRSGKQAVEDMVFYHPLQTSR